MCVRGLLLLMINDQFADYMGQTISEKILTMVIDILGDAVAEERRTITDLAEHAPAVQYLAILPTNVLHEFIMQLQNVLTLNII